METGTGDKRAYADKNWLQGSRVPSRPGMSHLVSVIRSLKKGILNENAERKPISIILNRKNRTHISSKPSANCLKFY